jgi:hypothetical protein
LAQVTPQEDPEDTLRLHHDSGGDIHCEAREPCLSGPGQECLGWVGASCLRNR